ncbi:uncharacterized protein LOC112593468 [Melanaphis sacchari]|uniref:uncharacterized protein LOC112593468 n=1 Tax=Melanaphis sacchari TaxID=742174 RepID=UPI000DC139CE|nr:uncharacterized protein LOC112593468 [Melanaphis sacchari]
MMAALKNAIKQQNKALSILMAATDHLNLAKEKTKSPIVVGAIEEATRSAEALKATTSNVHSAFYEAEKAAMRSHTPDHNAASLANQEAILRVCEDLRTCVTQQQEEIIKIKSTQAAVAPSYASKAGANRDPSKQPKTDLTAGLQRTEQPAQDWTKVTRSRPRKKTPKKPPVENTQRSKRPRPDSIAVKPEGGETYSSILKAIREKVDANEIGCQISSIKESRKGQILIRLHHNDQKREELAEALKNLGDRAVVRGLVSQDELDIRDPRQRHHGLEVECCIRSSLDCPQTTNR